jgi:hypothetical protein
VWPHHSTYQSKSAKTIGDSMAGKEPQRVALYIPHNGRLMRMIIGHCHSGPPADY